MRSYFVSLLLVAAVLFGYTAIVLTMNSSSAQPSSHASTDRDHREPATAQITEQ